MESKRIERNGSFRNSCIMKKYRNEWKYHCTQTELSVIEQQLGVVMARDMHAGPDGKYCVHSLYFDDINNSCFCDTQSGLDMRYKYRIRYYDEDSGHLRLEKKEKLDGGCYKRTCALTEAEYRCLVQGDVVPLVYETEKPLLREFCAAIMKRNFTPRVIVEYHRLAFVEPIANVRITMDTNIAVSKEYGEFLNGDYLRIPLMKKDEHVLEVKFDSILPGYIKRSLHQINLQQQTFSKYALGYERLRSLK